MILSRWNIVKFPVVTMSYNDNQNWSTAYHVVEKIKLPTIFRDGQLILGMLNSLETYKLAYALLRRSCALNEL